jgi:hypothetical protein
MSFPLIHTSLFKILILRTVLMSRDPSQLVTFVSAFSTPSPHTGSHGPEGSQLQAVASSLEVWSLMAPEARPVLPGRDWQQWSLCPHLLRVHGSCPALLLWIPHHLEIFPFEMFPGFRGSSSSTSPQASWPSFAREPILLTDALVIINSHLHLQRVSQFTKSLCIHYWHVSPLLRLAERGLVHPICRWGNGG